MCYFTQTATELSNLENIKSENFFTTEGKESYFRTKEFNGKAFPSAIGLQVLDAADHNYLDYPPDGTECTFYLRLVQQEPTKRYSFNN